MNFELSLLQGVYNYTIHIKRSWTETHILQTDAVKHKAPHMPTVAQFQLLLTVQISFQVHSFKMEWSMNFKLTVTSSHRDVSKFVKQYVYSSLT